MSERVRVRDVRKAGVEDRYWRAKANDRREWQQIVRNAIDKLEPAPPPPTHDAA